MILSPAKVNLFLRVLARRSDGYHDIASLFQAVNLFDRIYYSFSDEDQLTCTDPRLVTDETNLIFKALNVFREKMRLRFFLNIHLEKNIPIESGLGGGSGNAATMLFLCNALHGFPLEEKELISLSSSIGSDVAFFFSSGSAYCTGRGENIESFDAIKTLKKFWLVKPPLSLATPKVYSYLEPKKFSDMDPKFLLKSCLSGTFLSVNDLEASAFCLSPELKDFKQNLLDQGFESVFMTGSGTAFICVGENKPLVNSKVICYPLSFVNRKEGNWYL